MVKKTYLVSESAGQWKGGESALCNFLFLTGSITLSQIIYSLLLTTANNLNLQLPVNLQLSLNLKPLTTTTTNTRWEFGHLIVEASRQKWTNEPLGEALDSNEASDVTSDVISAKRYKPRYALRLEVLHFRDTRFEAPVSFVTSLVRAS